MIGRVWISGKSIAKQKQAAGKVLKKSSYKEEEGKVSKCKKRVMFLYDEGKYPSSLDTGSQLSVSQINATF